MLAILKDFLFPTQHKPTSGGLQLPRGCLYSKCVAGQLLCPRPTPGPPSSLTGTTQEPPLLSLLNFFLKMENLVLTLYYLQPCTGFPVAFEKLKLL